MSTADQETSTIYIVTLSSFNTEDHTNSTSLLGSFKDEDTARHCLLDAVREQLEESGLWDAEGDEEWDNATWEEKKDFVSEMANEEFSTDGDAYQCEIEGLMGWNVTIHESEL